jgi:hypothetical protein
VHDLELRARDLEHAAVLDVEVGLDVLHELRVLALVGEGAEVLTPEQTVARVQRDRCRVVLIGLGDLQDGTQVTFAAIRADDRHHLPLADRLEDRLGVVGRIDHDHRVVVSDEVGVALDLVLGVVDSDLA